MTRQEVHDHDRDCVHVLPSDDVHGHDCGHGWAPRGHDCGHDPVHDSSQVQQNI